MILTYVSSGLSGIRNVEREGTECRLCPGIHGQKKAFLRKRKSSRDKYQLSVMSRGQDTRYDFLICVVAIYKLVWVSLYAAVQVGANTASGHWKFSVSLLTFCISLCILYKKMKCLHILYILFYKKTYNFSSDKRKLLTLNTN